MILHRDHVTIEGGLYRLCESTFVDLQLHVMCRNEPRLYPRVVLKDALGGILGRSVGANPFPTVALALATAECLPINLKLPPPILPEDEICLKTWSEKSLGDRALICLDAIFDRARPRKAKRIPHLELMLRTLEHISGIHVTFRMRGDQIAEIVTCFGQSDRAGFTVTAIPDGDHDIVGNSFVPVSESCET